MRSSLLESLKPTEATRVYDILQQAGFDLSDWEIRRDGTPALNPRVGHRTYEWSFQDKRTGEALFMLWWDDVEEVEGRVRFRQAFRPLQQRLSEAGEHTKARHCEDFILDVSSVNVGQIVRVALVTGRVLDSTGERSTARVECRGLDPEPWHLSAWDPIAAEVTFIRGLPPTPQASLAADLAELAARTDVPATQRQVLADARIGQGKFREQLLRRWNSRCAVTGARTTEALRASHAKRWADSDDLERVDPANGLLLVATLDALFDVGLISFDDDGTLLRSPRFDDANITLGPARLREPLSDDERRYLAHHRSTYFQRGD